MRRVPRVTWANKFGSATFQHLTTKAIVLEVIGQKQLDLRIGCKGQQLA
jgi:hypothetical protein